MYSAKIDGEPTTFGTSGLLYRSNKLMYDRKTNTLWSSLVGEPVIGELAERDDLKLDFFPVSLTSWAEWLEEHPDTGVISNDTGVYRPGFYRHETDSSSIYYDYRESAETMFPVWLRDGRLAAKDEVLALSADDAHKAYPIAALNDLRVVNDTLGDAEIVIVASSISPDARAFERGGERFALDPDAPTAAAPTSLIDERGGAWRVSPDALIGPDGQTLRRLQSHVSFWFGWFAFHPDTLLFEAE